MNFETLNQINKLVLANPGTEVFYHTSFSDRPDSSVNYELKVDSVGLERIYDGGDSLYPVIGEDEIEMMEDYYTTELGWSLAEARSHLFNNSKYYIVVRMSLVV